MDRRIFLKMNLAASAVFVAGSNALADIATNERFADFLFLETHKKIQIRSVKSGTKAIRFQSDPMGLWVDHCLPAIQNGAPVFSGITSGHTVFSLSEIAKDYGYKIEQSALMQDVNAISLLDLSNNSSDLLEYLDLNQPGYVVWVLAPQGISFR